MYYWKYEVWLMLVASLMLSVVCSGQEIILRPMDRMSYESYRASQARHDAWLQSYEMGGTRAANAKKEQAAKELKEMRTWVSASGAFTVEARLVEYWPVDKVVVLDRKEDRTSVEVPVSRLSEKDRRWLTSELERQAREKHDSEATAKRRAKTNAELAKASGTSKMVGIKGGKTLPPGPSPRVMPNQD